MLEDLRNHRLFRDWTAFDFQRHVKSIMRDLSELEEVIYKCSQSSFAFHFEDNLLDYCLRNLWSSHYYEAHLVHRLYNY